VNVVIYVGWAGMDHCCRKTVTRPVNLAQASQSRLGETNRDSPKPLLRERSPRRPALYFERASISPRREGSRLSEIPRCFLGVFEPSLRRRGLAWARMSRLSETLQPERGVGRDSAEFWLYVYSRMIGIVWVWLLWWDTCTYVWIYA